MRVIHACWDSTQIEVARQLLTDDRLTSGQLKEATTERTELYNAIETLLKGFEVPLPRGITFLDKDKHLRDAVRVRWWERDARTLGEVVQPPTIDIGEAASLPIPENSPRYTVNEPPCFVGHYWLKGQPAVQASNVACLDYSVAKDGKLVAYRWCGEQVLDAAHFSYLEA